MQHKDIEVLTGKFIAWILILIKNEITLFTVRLEKLKNNILYQYSLTWKVLNQ